MISMTGVMGMPLISGMNTAHEFGCYVVLYATWKNPIVDGRNPAPVDMVNIPPF